MSSAAKKFPIPAAFALALALGISAPNASALEERSFVISWFTDANYFGGEEDCPDGLNLSSMDFYRRDLSRIGLSQDRIEDLLKDFPGEGGGGQPWVPLVTTRGNGTDNVYLHPTTAPDPGLRTVQGRFAYGFNLDKKISGEDFIEPDTEQRGIDNQYYRALGCLRSFRGLPPPGRPAQSENNWDTVRHQMLAWLITVKAPSGFDQDGRVTVTIDRAVEPAIKAANGAIQSDMTYHADPDPRTRHVLGGDFVDGVITTDAADISIIADPFIMAVFNFTNARLRLKISTDGHLEGLVGGYLPWREIWYSFANQGHIKEYAASIDMPGLYYALRRLADGGPKNEDGIHPLISSAYRIEAAPAFVALISAETASARD